jgi:hypothetical protein
MLYGKKILWALCGRTGRTPMGPGLPEGRAATRWAARGNAGGLRADTRIVQSGRPADLLAEMFSRISQTADRSGEVLPLLT